MDKPTPRAGALRTPGHRPVAVEAVASPIPPDIDTLIHRVLAHWPVIIATVIVGAIVTTAVVRTRKPMYKSETVIVYREGIGKSVSGPSDSSDAIRTLGTKLKETLFAQQTLRKLIDELHLYPDVLQRAGYAAAVDQMRKKTEFKSRALDTFAIAFEGADRDQAQQVCARMAEILVADNARRQDEENRGATEFLDGEKKRADAELDRIEREVSAFLQVHPEFATAKEGLGTEVLALQKKAQEEEKRRRSMGGAPRARPELEGLPVLVDAPAIDPVLLHARAQASGELTAARKELAEQSFKYTDLHPDVRAAKERVAAAEAALKVANQAIAAAWPKEAPAPHRTAVPEEEPAAPSSRAATAPAPSGTGKSKLRDPDQREKVAALEMEWSRLGRELDLARTNQLDLEQKRRRAGMLADTAANGYGPAITVLDPAFKPSGPSSTPNRTVAAFGLVASVAIGFLLSAVWGLFLDDRLFLANEIEAFVMVPVLGVVPKSRRGARAKGIGL